VGLLLKYSTVAQTVITFVATYLHIQCHSLSPTKTCQSINQLFFTYSFRLSFGFFKYFLFFCIFFWEVFPCLGKSLPSAKQPATTLKLEAKENWKFWFIIRKVFHLLAGPRLSGPPSIYLTPFKCINIFYSIVISAPSSGKLRDQRLQSD